MGDGDERTYCTSKKEVGKDGEYKGEFELAKHVEYDKKEECDQDKSEHGMGRGRVCISRGEMGCGGMESGGETRDEYGADAVQ